MTTYYRYTYYDALQPNSSYVPQSAQNYIYSSDVIVVVLLLQHKILVGIYTDIIVAKLLEDSFARVCSNRGS